MRLTKILLFLTVLSVVFISCQEEEDAVSPSYDTPSLSDLPNTRFLKKREPSLGGVNCDDDEKNGTIRGPLPVTGGLLNTEAGIAFLIKDDRIISANGTMIRTHGEEYDGYFNDVTFHWTDGLNDFSKYDAIPVKVKANYTSLERITGRAETRRDYTLLVKCDGTIIVQSQDIP